MLTKVLIVDDHPAMLLALRTLFSQQVPFEIMGYAHDGESCLTLTKNLEPDMIVLDLDLPRTDGFDLINKLKNINASIKILILSSHEEKVYGNRVRALGAQGFVNKAASGKIIITAAIAVSQGYTFFTANTSQMSPKSDEEKLSKISDREFQVLKFLGKGFSNTQISEHLHISNKTVATYKSRLYEKLAVNNIADLISFCRQNNVCD
ncbi:MAG: response regulator transcription factor [Betaproteobacteria bacterium]|jgi:two-component system response regulator FimZ (fimbrial Z protein)/two-component system response regulator EvgA